MAALAEYARDDLNQNELVNEMNVKNKVSLLLLAGYLLLLLVLLGQRFLFVIPELKTLQKQSDANEIERVVKALEYQQIEISRFTYDYGVWDDTYDYIASRDQEYIDSNYLEDTFASLAINGVFIYDSKGSPVWSKTFRKDASWIAFSEIFSSDNDIARLAFTGFESELDSAVTDKGIIAGRNYPVLYSRVTILPSDLKGVPKGTFVVVRELSSQVVAQAIETSQIAFKLYLAKDVGNSPDLAAIAPKLDLQINQSGFRNNGHGYRWLKNKEGQPVALLEVKLTDAVYKDQWLDQSSWWVLAVATFTMLWVRYALGFVVIKPLMKIKRFLIRVRDTSNYSLRIEDSRKDEIGELAHECDRLVDYVHAQEQYLREINQDLTKKTLKDGLTEVANRRHFDVKLDLLWRAFYQKRQPLFLILIDVDNFKAYNDNYGHLKGDEALKLIADVLLRNVRVSTDMVARYGGEEFVILLSETDVVGVKVVCDKLLNAIRTLNIPHEFSDASSRVTVSMGVAGWIPDSEDAKALIKAADDALYQAKNAGRDCVQYHIRDDSIGR